MNSQDFDYLSREIESIRRELGAGIPVPEKKSAAASTSDTISFPSMKDQVGASVVGFADEYRDGDTGFSFLPFFSPAIPGVPTSSADFETRLLWESGSYPNPVFVKSFCYDVDEVGETLDLHYISGGAQYPLEYGTPPYPYYLSNAITLSKVSSSRTRSSPIYCAIKVVEARSYLLSNWSSYAVLGSIENASETNAITGVDSTHFVVAGNKTTTYQPGTVFSVFGSTGNDGTYVVESSSYDSGPDTTTVVPVESIPDTTVDGSIEVFSGILSESPVGVGSLLRPPVEEVLSLCTYSKAALAWQSYPANWKTSYSASYSAPVGFYSGSSIYVSNRVRATYSSVTKYPFYYSDNVCLNPFSTPDTFIPPGYVSLEQKSYGSNTVIIRLRHAVTGDLYVGEMQITSTSVYDTNGSSFLGSGTRYNRKPGFMLPPRYNGQLRVWESTLTMTALPSS
jgi:hypothetical protein